MAANTASVPAFTVASQPTGTFTIGDTSFPWSTLAPASAAATNLTVTVDGTPHTLALTGLSTASTATAYAGNLAIALNAIAAKNYTGTNLPTTLTASNVLGAVTLSSTTLSITPDANGTSGAITWTSGTSGTDGTSAQQIADSPYGITSPVTSGSVADATISLKFAGSTTQAISLNFGTYGGSTGVTQFSDTAATVSVSNFSQNGLPKGSFNSVAIDSNGNVTLNYSNGTNKTIAQIPVAQFYAQDQLQQVTGGAYTTTLASGSARLSSPGVNGSGTLSSNSLEQSNVDISTQFTNLIQAQQVYTANAKVVTTDNSLLQVTLNMIQ
jgi:flagellar hook protein FlgE